MTIRRRPLFLVLAALLLAAPAHALGPSQTIEQKVLEWLTKQTAFGTAPTTLYVSLHGTDPGDTCANELAATGSYARAQLNPDTNNSTNTNWNAINTASAASSMTNKLAVAFPTATANWNSGSAIPYFCLEDASTSGTCFWCGQIAGGTGVTVLNGTTLTFAAGTPGAMAITLD